MSIASHSRRLGALLPLALATACVDNGHADLNAVSCMPLVKFSHPDGVTPQAVDGVVSLPVEATTCDRDDLVLWAWSSEGNLDHALDIFEDESGKPLVLVPVTGAYDEPCQTSTITVALVDDQGDVVDQDRAFLEYSVAR